MIRANTSENGLNIGHENVNMTYLYGLGDFFSVMFEDTSVTNLLLESTSMVASEVYSRFLQLSSTQSLEDIQTTTGSQIQLVLVNSTDLIEGTATEYRLPASYTFARYIANRPLMPTELLETDVDFRIVQDEDGSCRIRFAQRLDDYAISSRLLVDGVTKQYALWLTDTQLDERLISKHYGNLIGLDPENSTEKFANFVYGLYYVYVQGPTLSTLRKGLNLALGIPLARLNETVIDIRTYLQTDQYIVVTDQNQYLIPFGLQPSVEVGDVLNVGDEIAGWVELKDYLNDGEWWANLYIPSNVIPTVPPGQNTRYATAGSELDYIMRNYLRTHTFLVNVNVTTFKQNQQFSQLFDIIRRAKPAYTQPIYVWTVKNDEKVLFDETLTFGLDSFYGEDIGGGYSYMRRNAERKLLRGKSRFIRFNAPALAANTVGDDVYVNSSGNTFQAEGITGYANTVSHFRPNTLEEASWVDVIANRSSETWHRRRNQVGFRRGMTVVDNNMVEPTPATPTLLRHPYSRLSDLFEGVTESARVVPLAVISQSEIELKCGLLGITPPEKNKKHFILGDNKAPRTINEYTIDDSFPVGPRLDQLYPDLFRRDSDLRPTMDLNAFMLKQFLPDKSKLTDSDMIVGFRITCDLIAMCLLSHNPDLASPSFSVVDDPLDVMDATIESTPMRGLAPHGTPFYMGRGNISLRVTTSTVEPDTTDRSKDLALFLQGVGAADLSRVIPLTVISRAELELKCGLWGIQKPAEDLTYFIVNGRVSREAVNSMPIDSSIRRAIIPANLVSSRLNPVTSQVEPYNPLYPDFYRRDSDVPAYKDLTRYNLMEYVPTINEIDNKDMLLGYRLERDVIALYLISNASQVSARDFWRVRYDTPRLTRVGSGQLEELGKVIVPPYSTTSELSYNTYDLGLNEAPVNAGLDPAQSEFLYRDTHNTTMPVTRGGMRITHRVHH